MGTEQWASEHYPQREAWYARWILWSKSFSWSLYTDTASVSFHLWGAVIRQLIGTTFPWAIASPLRTCIKPKYHGGEQGTKNKYQSETQKCGNVTELKQSLWLYRTKTFTAGRWESSQSEVPQKSFLCGHLQVQAAGICKVPSWGDGSAERFSSLGIEKANND